jgi:hypothetical protein
MKCFKKFFTDIPVNKNIINRKFLSKRNKMVILKFLLKRFSYKFFYKNFYNFSYKWVDPKFLKRPKKIRFSKKRGGFKKYLFKKLFFEFFSSFALRVDFLEKLLRSKKNKVNKFLNIKKKNFKFLLKRLGKSKNSFLFSKKSKDLYFLKNFEKDLNIEKKVKSLFFLRFSRGFIKKVFFLKKKGYLKKIFFFKGFRKFSFRRRYKKRIFFQFSRFF